VSQEQSQTTGPDFAAGVARDELTDGKLLGHVGDQAVLLVDSGGALFAIDAHCTHYGGPLAEGLVAGETIRCPWHHACFSLRSGEALHAPAINPLSAWDVEETDGRIFVREKRPTPKRATKSRPSAPQNVVIVGGGAAGFAAAEMLRREGFAGDITLLSNDADAPVDRPNLSKDYLAGSAPEEWMPLREKDFYAENNIDLRLKTDVASIDIGSHHAVTADGARIAYDRLLLAMGAEPIRLDMPGAQQPNVHTLRSFADCRAIIADAKTARSAVVIGASFIGLETAAALRTRGIEVHVVAPEKRPMERILGPDMGDFIRALHEEHGVVFHLEDTVVAMDGSKAKLKSGITLEAGLVVVGVGVKPRLTLAEQAGLKMERGVAVDAFLETSAKDVYAAGDIARWPDRHSGANIRVEHWVVAQRQGQTAARNILGERCPFDAVPFFWSQHYDVPINYIGHAEQWDAIEIDGDIKARACLLRYRHKGRVMAVASIYRDLENLRAELEMEQAL
jgi:NADPH-dependent 2,4-dienoyl-CoA reductase/sulfur reductase-like enzyme/nitrite reductase/ring-hydroxylating ferredoxin subunit